MGGIGLSSTDLNRIPHTHTYAHNTHTDTHTPAHTQTNIYICTEQKKYTYMQHIQDSTENNTEQRTDTETNIHTQDDAQPQRTEHSADSLHTYSNDIYHEYIAIRNSNTIELYTISKE